MQRLSKKWLNATFSSFYGFSSVPGFIDRLSIRIMEIYECRIEIYAPPRRAAILDSS
jgi:hypothetical protein